MNPKINADWIAGFNSGTVIWMNLVIVTGINQATIIKPRMLWANRDGLVKNRASANPIVN
jgi:hypothetical protein